MQDHRDHRSSEEGSSIPAVGWGWKGAGGIPSRSAGLAGSFRTSCVHGELVGLRSEPSKAGGRSREFSQVERKAKVPSGVSSRAAKSLRQRMPVMTKLPCHAVSGLHCTGKHAPGTRPVGFVSRMLAPRQGNARPRRKKLFTADQQGVEAQCCYQMQLHRGKGRLPRARLQWAAHHAALLAEACALRRREIGRESQARWQRTLRTSHRFPCRTTKCISPLAAERVQRSRRRQIVHAVARLSSKTLDLPAGGSASLAES